jgi:hypothetical protein
MMDFLNNMMSQKPPMPTQTATPGGGVTITEPPPGMDMGKMMGGIGGALNQMGQKGAANAAQAMQQAPTNPMQASAMSSALRGAPAGGQMFNPNAPRM